MIKKLTLIVFLVFAAFYTNGQVKIGDNPTTLSSSSILELESTSKGFVPTRLDANQISNLADPATGMMVYNTNLSCIQVNLGTPAIPTWECLVTSGSLMADPVSKSRNWMFVTNQGGGNNGLTIFLQESQAILFTKFMTEPGESISKLQLVLYSDRSFNLGIIIDESTLDPLDIDGGATPLYPRPGDGPNGQLVPIIGLGPGANGKNPQVVEFNFNPALMPTESAMSLYLINLGSSGITPVFGVYQIVID